MAKEQKFETSYYCGPMLPPMYEVKGYVLAGEALSPLAEEMLYDASAKCIENKEYFDRLVKHAKTNFYNCLKRELSDKQKVLKFPEDFISLMTQMKADQKLLKAKKDAAKTPESEAARKAKAAEDKETYGFATIDGEKTQISGYLVETPGIILTRPGDPRFGNWKYRVTEKDITLNIVGSKKPKQWKGKIESNNTVQWIYKYKQQCGVKGSKTYCELPKKVEIVNIKRGNSEKKFNKSNNVLANWKALQNKIDEALHSDDEVLKQTALVTYLIQLTGIRVGNERNLDKVADTVGATTLRKENMSFHTEA